MSDDFSQFQLGRKANSTNGFTIPSPEATNAFNQVGNNTLVQNNPVQSPNYIPGQYGFTLNPDGSAEFQDIVATGNITAETITVDSGTIADFEIGTDYIRDVGNSFGLASTVTGSDDVRFWAGDTYANRATADFRVTEAGAVTASNLTITGGSVAVSTLNGTISLSNLNAAAQGWTQTSVFSVTDADTVAWGAGTFTTAAGTSYSINSGNTGNMAAATYIYLDTGVSTTAYQTTTTATTAVGSGKVLIAKAQNGTGEATFQVFGGIGGQNIDAASIVANSITANELSTSITYAGTIILDTSGEIRSGQTNYDTGTGWWIGDDLGTPKLSIGNSSGNKLTWNGTTLSIVGTIGATATINAPLVQSFTAGENITAEDAVYLQNTASSYTDSFDFELSSNEYLSIADASQTGLEFTGDFTIEMWFRFESDTGNSAMVSKFLSGDKTMLVRCNPDASNASVQLALSTDGTTDNAVTATGLSIPVGSWAYLAISYATSGTTVIYTANEYTPPTVRSTSGTISGSGWNSAAAFQIGAFNGASEPMDGLIAEVRVWSDVRTPEEIGANYNVALVGNEANLVGYWKFDNNLLDETSNNNDLTYNGSASATYSSTVPTNTSPRLFRSNSGDSVSNDFIGIANSAITSGNDGLVTVAGTYTFTNKRVGVGGKYYISSTDGSFATSGTRKIGVGMGSDKLLITNIW